MTATKGVVKRQRLGESSDSDGGCGYDNKNNNENNNDDDLSDSENDRNRRHWQQQQQQQRQRQRQHQRQRRTVYLFLYKIVVLIMFSALLFPCVAIQQQQQQQPTHDVDPGLPVQSVVDETYHNANANNNRYPFLVVCTVDGYIHIVQASDGSPVCSFKSGIPLVAPSVPIPSSTTSSSSAMDDDPHHHRIVPGLDGRLYVSDDDDDDDGSGQNSEGGILRPLEITVLDVLKNPVQTCRRTSTSSTQTQTPPEHQEYSDEVEERRILGPSATTTKTECGIITATKSVSLFAIDASTGLLVWQQYPNGTTTQIEYDDDDDDDDDVVVDDDNLLLSPPRPRPRPSNGNSGGRTVLLQREDITVQQIDTDTGKSVWNVSLGTQQALDFGGDPSYPRSGGGGGTSSSSSRSRSRRSASGGSSSSHPPLLPGGRSTTKDLMIDEYVEEELPYVMFSRDGKRLTAVSPPATTTTTTTTGPTTTTAAKELWGHDFPTVVASVFGLNGRSWRPLTVIEDADYDSDSDDNNQAINKWNRQQLPDSPSGITLYKSPYSNPFLPFSMEQLYDGIDWVLRMTSGSSRDWKEQPTMISEQDRSIVLSQDDKERFISGLFPQRGGHILLPMQQQQDDNYRHSSFLELPSPSDKKQDNQNSYIPPNILMAQGGIYLTFPVIGGVAFFFVLGVVLGTRYVYKRKKAKWMISQQLSRVSFRSNQSISESDSRRSSMETTVGHTGSGKPPTNPKSFLRSLSLPGKMDEMEPANHNAKVTTTQSKVSTDLILASPNLARSTTTTANTPRTKQEISYENGTLTSLKRPPQRAESTPPPLTPERPTAPKRTETSSTEASFSLIDGSIPLIRYARYASEFVELAVLGKGGFGSVFQCRNVLDGREYAIKKVAIRRDAKISQEDFSRRLQRTLREVKSLALLDHPNIVRYYTAWLEQTKDGDGYPDHSVGSEYYITTPTKVKRNDFASAGDMPSQSWADRSSGSGFLQRRFSYGDSSNGRTKSDADDSVSASQDLDHSIQGIPASLDDYGFVFDRSSENDTTENGKNENINCSSDSLYDGTTTAPSKDHFDEETFENRRRRKESDSSKINRRAISFQSLSDSSNAEISAVGQSVESRNQSDGKQDAHQQQKSDTKPLAKSTTQGDHILEESGSSQKYVLYIQMQFCSQKTIADFLSNEEARKGPTKLSGVDIPYALYLFLQIAMGVKSVHLQGLIHRDLKPNNCFVDDAGVVKVGDFGLSRESSDNNGAQTGDEDEKKPAPSILKINDYGDITAGVGTRSYASPEQMKGGSEYDSSTDIYSLGIILFEMCYPMYTGMERNIVLSNLRNHIFPNAWISETVPEFPSLHELLGSMISNTPESRPSAEEVVHRIESILEGFTVSSLDKKHREGAILLRIETLPREDVLRRTMELVKEAALPEKIEIVQYGLRGGENKQIMEFAVVSDTNNDVANGCKTGLGNKLVTRLREDDNVLLIREVRPRSGSTDDGK